MYPRPCRTSRRGCGTRHWTWCRTPRIAVLSRSSWTMRTAKLEPDVTKRAKQIARNAVDQLGPDDLAAVVFTFLGRAQNFTADRSQLVQAIESYTPKTTGTMGPPAICDPRHRSCDVEALAAVASTLVSAPPGRKILILISGGRAFTFGEIGVPSSPERGNGPRAALRRSSTRQHHGVCV